MNEEWKNNSWGGGLSPAGVERLKLAIVKQAADDYVDIKAGFVLETSECNLRELNHFFQSDWYESLCKIAPDYLIKELERKIKNMVLKYTIAKEKGSSRYYVHKVDNPSPIPDTYGTKKQALHIAAKLNELPYRDYMKVRRKAGVK